MKRKREDAYAPNKRQKVSASPSQMALTTKVSKLQYAVNQLQKDSELKIQDQQAAGNLVVSGSYATAENCITRVTQGIAGNNRIGIKIAVQGILIKFFLRSRTAELTEATNIRVVCFIDKSPETGIATAPVLQSLFTPNGLLNNTGTTLVHANTNWPVRKRYKVLYDKVVTINPDMVLDYDPVTGNTTSIFPKTQEYKKFIPLKGLPVMYNGTGGLATDVATNSIWIWWGQTATGSGVGATVDYSTRLYFRDA
jgi:hypothetical protein